MPGMMVNLVVHKDQEGHIEDDAPVPVPVSSNSFVTHEIETLTPPVQEGNREEAKEAVDKARATILQDDLRNVLDPQATETP